MTRKILKTRRGDISFPAYIPVTTFGNKYPLDRLIRPYLPRLSTAVMVSYHYAKEIEEEFSLPLFVDSGGFAALFASAEVTVTKGLGIIKYKNEHETEIIGPKGVLELQERVADVAFTLDFPIPPNLDRAEAKKRQKLTIANALWAKENRRRNDLPLYAVVQAWDVESARNCAREFKGAGFDGIAIGGLVPRSRNMDLVVEIVEAVKNESGDALIHVFGLGKPEIVQRLFSSGVDSVDSSSYVKMAADGKLWGQQSKHGSNEFTPSERLHIALCNLANATGTTLPLSASRLMFSPKA